MKVEHPLKPMENTQSMQGEEDDEAVDIQREAMRIEMEHRKTTNVMDSRESGCKM